MARLNFPIVSGQAFIPNILWGDSNTQPKFLPYEISKKLQYGSLEFDKYLIFSLMV